jgi:DNA-binding protein HU-beta
LTKTELVKILSERTGLMAREVETVIDGAIALIMDSLRRGEYVQIRGFGTFKVVKRKARIARNPKKNEEVPLPDRYVPFFKPTREFKQMVIESLKNKITDEGKMTEVHKESGEAGQS